MQDINNINLDSMNEKENMINKEIDLNQELIEQKIIINKTTKDNLISEHKKCVPLQIYQKVYLDKQKLISEINELFLEAKKENLNNPRLFLKNGTEIKNNRKIKCIGALNLDNNYKITII